MGKKVALDDRPGASAWAEGRRARRAASRRGLVTGAFALIALTLLATGLATADHRLLVGSVAGAATAWRCRPVPDPDRWRRGADGEIATAQLLARLPRRFVVLHDRHQPGSKVNLDHVVIGPTGIWVVDSKARRAPLRIHRGQVWAGEHPIDVAPAARQAARLEHVLGASVKAIVAVHGEGLRGRGKVVEGVRVLPARRLLRRLRHRRLLFQGRRVARAELTALAARADRLFPPC